MTPATVISRNVRGVSQVTRWLDDLADDLDVRADEVGSNVGQHRFGGEAPEIG